MVKMSEIIHPSWNTIICDDFKSYQDNIDDLKRGGFKCFGKPLPKDNTDGLQKLVDHEHDVMRITHFDEEHNRSEDLMETYIKLRYK